MCEGLHNKIDNKFVVDMETADNKKGFVFTGFTKNMLLLNPQTNRWSIVSLDDESVIMELDVEVTNQNNMSA